ncbi:hypothetical protein [Streptomyces cinereospinus]|uniref:MalT-like TPR region domain-containing protein n=1 Tax=Streptomyces cinereospinus TaxID=285561 RepID=A0ABV5N676_9ACTN
MYEVKERAQREGFVYVNLPAELEATGRSGEAVPILGEGTAFARKLGLLDTEAWVWANLSESLHSLGRWQEAGQAARNALRRGRSAKPQGSGAVRLAHLALGRGEVAEAKRRLDTARATFGSHDPMPQQWLPMAAIAVGVAAAEDRVLDARAELDAALDAGTSPGTQQYGWPLLLAAATAEAGARATAG